MRARSAVERTEVMPGEQQQELALLRRRVRQAERREIRAQRMKKLLDHEAAGASPGLAALDESLKNALRHRYQLKQRLAQNEDVDTLQVLTADENLQFIYDALIEETLANTRVSTESADRFAGIVQQINTRGSNKWKQAASALNVTGLSVAKKAHALAHSKVDDAEQELLIERQAGHKDRAKILEQRIELLKAKCSAAEMWSKRDRIVKAL